MLGEGLDDGRAKAPDVAGWGKRTVRGIRGPEPVTRQFQLIIDDQKVRRLQAAMHQVLAVKEGQGVEGGRQQFLHFVEGQGPTKKYLRETLLRIFHDHEEKRVSSQLTAA